MSDGVLSQEEINALLNGGIGGGDSSSGGDEAPAPEPAPKVEEPKELPPLDLPNNYDDIRHYDYMLDGSATAL